MKSMASYLYKAIDNESIIKNVWGICLDLGLKTQNTLKKLAVQKANPSKQGLKLSSGKSLSNIFTCMVQKANPSKQGLKRFYLVVVDFA